MKNLKAFEGFHEKPATPVTEAQTMMGSLEGLAFDVNVLEWMIDEGYLNDDGTIKNNFDEVDTLNDDINAEFGASKMFKDMKEVEAFLSTVCKEMAEFAKKYGKH